MRLARARDLVLGKRHRVLEAEHPGVEVGGFLRVAAAVRDVVQRLDVHSLLYSRPPHMEDPWTRGTTSSATTPVLKRAAKCSARATSTRRWPAWTSSPRSSPSS